MYTQSYLVHLGKDGAENEGILRCRGQAVDGRMTAEPPISVILATSSLLTVTFRAYGGRETSKKVRIHFNISKQVCLQFTNKIWLDMAEKGRSEGMRTKCTTALNPRRASDTVISSLCVLVRWNEKAPCPAEISGPLNAIVTFIQI